MLLYTFTTQQILTFSYFSAITLALLWLYYRFERPQLKKRPKTKARAGRKKKKPVQRRKKANPQANKPGQTVYIINGERYTKL